MFIFDGYHWHLWVELEAKMGYSIITKLTGFCVHYEKKTDDRSDLLRIFFVVPTHKYIPTDIYLFKVTNRITGKRCEICSKLTIKTERRHLRRLMFLLLTLSIFHIFF